MKVLAILLLATAILGTRTDHLYSIEKANVYFEEFIETFHKHYANEAEKEKRFEIFKQNLVLINQKNVNTNSGVHGITMFSDLTSEEFIETYTGLKGDILRQASECQTGSANTTSAPESWSWKDKGVISRPKDQGICGSCWAFSVIGNIEAHYAIKHNHNIDLSEQQLVDCDVRSNGCRGTNDMEYPFLYLIKNSGAMQEQDYPYQGRDQSCRFYASKVKVKVASCTTYSPTTEEELKNIVYSFGPISIAVDASGMQSYTSHVLPDCDFKTLNHAVLIVGYGTEDDTAYWLIKNSWGNSYGEDGFIKIRRGVNACGLMVDVAIGAAVN